MYWVSPAHFADEHWKTVDLYYRTDIRDLCNARDGDNDDDGGDDGDDDKQISFFSFVVFCALKFSFLYFHSHNIST